MSEIEHSPVLDGLIQALVHRSGGKARVLSHRSHDWQSLTFYGERHEIALASDERGPLDTMVAGLEDAEIELPGAMLCDIVHHGVSNGEPCTVQIDALTVDDE